MKLVIYALVLAVIAMLYKTFYYDYQKKEVPVERNTSAEIPEVNQAQSVQTIKTDEQNKTGWQSRKGMPIDRLGDTIGNSLKDKIKVQ